MAIDYALAGRWERVVHALALTESSELECAVGDGGRALGILQQHPSFFKQYYGAAKAFPASVKHTWTEAFIVAAASFFETWHFELDLAVQAYNQGVGAVAKGARAPEYLAKFKTHYASLGSE